MNILVTGGAGYVGSTLVPVLLNIGHNVTVLDKLMWGGDGLLPCIYNKSLHFVNSSILDKDITSDLLKKTDFIVHLAAYVGYPLCKKFPDEAKQTNVDASELLNTLRGSIPLIFASTCSNYGKNKLICTEETSLNPITLYSETKVLGENIFLKKKNTVCHRYSTAFGVSPRFRLDLLINNFCYMAKKLKSLIIYEGGVRRDFVHVKDMTKAIVFTIDNFDKMKGEIYNIGDESMNYNKIEIANIIKDRFDFYLHTAEIGEDLDKRDYRISFDKIKKLGFKSSINIYDGIDEILNAIDIINIENPYSNV